MPAVEAGHGDCGLCREEKVRRILVLCAGALVLAMPLSLGAARMSPGQEAFERHCHVCHPKGGNVINPAKTLRGSDLEKNNVRTAADIVSKMRNPGPGMTQFDEKTIPDATAGQIAEYIFETFK